MTFVFLSLSKQCTLSHESMCMRLVTCIRYEAMQKNRAASLQTLLQECHDVEPIVNTLCCYLQVQ